MSYGVAAALQEAVFQRLNTDSLVSSLVGGAIYDALPSGALPSVYLTLGPEDARERGDSSAGGAWHSFVVSVVSDGAGFLMAKQIAGAVSDSLVNADLALSRGQLTGIHFLRARARRQTGGSLRRIDLTFRAHVDDTP